MSIRLMTLAWDIHMPLATKFVFISLADQANDQNVCWPSLDYIAHRCGMHRRTVQRAILDLEEAGFIVARKREGRSTWYEFRPRAMIDAAEPFDKGCDTESRVAESHTGGDTKSRGGDSVPPITTNNHQLTLEATPYKPPKGGRISTRQTPGSEVYSQRFEEVWKSWPKGKGGSKADAYKAWLKRKLDDPEHSHVALMILHDVQNRASAHRQWLDGYTPHMSTYLNKSGWTADIDTSTGTRTNGRAKTTYEQIMEASERNRAALREDYDNMSDAEQREFRAAFGHG